MIDVNWVQSELKRTLAMLAAPAEDQLAYITNLDVSNDELALEFDGVAGASVELESMGVMNSDQVKAILAVDDQLESMSGQANARLGDDDGIRSDVRWECVRELAKHALGVLGGSP